MIDYTTKWSLPRGNQVVPSFWQATINTSNGHLQETYLPKIGTAWVTQDISNNAGTPAATGTPTAIYHDGYTSTFTINTSNGHLQETYLPKIGTAWVTQDISNNAGTPPATP